MPQRPLFSFTTQPNLATQQDADDGEALDGARFAIVRALSRETANAFVVWLVAQVQRDDLVGRMARDWASGDDICNLECLGAVVAEWRERLRP